MAEMSKHEAIRTIVTHQDCLIRNDVCNHECDKCVLDVPFLQLDKALTMACEYLLQPEIIHCRGCRKLEYPNEYFSFYVCGRTQTVMPDGFDEDKCFCSWAERRTDE